MSDSEMFTEVHVVLLALGIVVIWVASNFMVDFFGNLHTI